MKRKMIVISILLIALSFGYYLSLPDYYVYNSFSESNSYHNTRSTRLEVISYRYWNYEELFEDIETEHNTINGTPTELEINLYISKWHKSNGKAIKTKTIEY